MRFRILVFVLGAALFLTVGCSGVLDRLTGLNEESVPTLTTSDGSAQSTAQILPRIMTLQELEIALRDQVNVKLIAQDTGQSLALDEAKRKELIKYLAEAGELKESKALAEAVASAEFPAYQIKLEDVNISIDLFDDLRLGSGSENARFYYMEKGEIWKSVNKWLPPKVYQESSLGFLFKANKVTLKGGMFAEETDQTPYRNAILRLIRSVNLQATPLPQNPGEFLLINFSVGNAKYGVQVYDEYITYRNTSYKLPKAKLNIENLLSPS